MKKPYLKSLADLKSKVLFPDTCGEKDRCEICNEDFPFDHLRWDTINKCYACPACCINEFGDLEFDDEKDKEIYNAHFNFSN